MAWNKKTANDLLVLNETYTLPASAVNGYSSVIKNIKPKIGKTSRYMSFMFNASAVTGTNLDMMLYGSDTEAGTEKYLLKDAIISDITATGWTLGRIDLNSYVAPYYFLAWLADTDEHLNTIEVKVFG